SSGTWCGRSSARCSSAIRPSSRASSKVPRGPPAARPRRRGGCTSWASDTTDRPGYDRPVRFPVVLFDLDGTVVASGRIILASMRHAPRTVLEREIPDAELMAAVGGPGLEAQMRAFAPDRVDELVRVYREHNEPLHDELESCLGIEAVLVRLKEEGRRLGIVSAKRRRTVQLAFAQVPVAQLIEVIVGGDGRVRQEPHPEPVVHRRR